MNEQEILNAQDLITIAPGNKAERDVLNIVQWIRDYDPNLDVMYLDPGKCDSPFDAPYIIVEHCNDGVTRLVCSVWTLDDRVKQKILAADTFLSPVKENFEAVNEAARKAQRDMWKERTAEVKDQGTHLLKNPKTSYTMKNDKGELIKIEDDFGVVKRDGRNEHD